jgi:hypothetical protein
MAQISKGTTYTAAGAGSLVTYLNLNAHVDNATLLAGAITDQTALSINNVSSLDMVLLYDTSDGTLKKATISDLFNSNLNATIDNLVITTDLQVGNIAEIDQIQSSGSGVLVDDDLTVQNTLLVTGNSTLTGDVTVDNGFTSNGTANFTGNLQVNGVNVYFLSEVIEENIPYATGVTANTLHNLFTSASYTKPVDEIWVIEIDAIMWSLNNSNTHYRLTNSADTTNFMIGYAATNSAYDVFDVKKVCFLNSSSTYTGTFVFRVKCNQPTISISPNATELSTGTGYPDASKGSIGNFRIYKYKTS